MKRIFFIILIFFFSLFAESGSDTVTVYDTVKVVKVDEKKNSLKAAAFISLFTGITCLVISIFSAPGK